MNALAALAALSETEMDTFQTLVRQFLEGRCFVRAASTTGTAAANRSDARWRFLLKQQALFEAYFDVAGWTFELRPDLGAATVRSTRRTHSHFFSRQQTQVVYHLLALHYEVTTGGDIEQAAVTVAVGDLLERLQQRYGPEGIPDRTSLIKLFKKLKTFGAIEFPTDCKLHPTDVITIHPVVELLIPKETIAAQLTALQAWTPPGEGEDGGVADEAMDAASGMAVNDGAGDDGDDDSDDELDDAMDDSLDDELGDDDEDEGDVVPRPRRGGRSRAGQTTGTALAG